METSHAFIVDLTALIGAMTTFIGAYVTYLRAKRRAARQNTKPSSPGFLPPPWLAAAAVLVVGFSITSLVVSIVSFVGLRKIVPELAQTGNQVADAGRQITNAQIRLGEITPKPEPHMISNHWSPVYTMATNEYGLYVASDYGHSGAYFFLISYFLDPKNTDPRYAPVDRSITPMSSSNNNSGYQMEWQITRDGKVQAKHNGASNQSFNLFFTKLPLGKL